MVQFVACVQELINISSRSEFIEGGKQRQAAASSGKQWLHKTSLIKSFLSPRRRWYFNQRTRDGQWWASACPPIRNLFTWRWPATETALRVLMKYPGRGGRAIRKPWSRFFQQFSGYAGETNTEAREGAEGVGEGRGEKVREYKPRRNN